MKRCVLVRLLTTIFLLYKRLKGVNSYAQVVKLQDTRSTLMNYATQELTNSLQELTSKAERQPRKIEPAVPASIAAGDFSFSKEVESFLEKTRAYSAKTRGVHVGTY